MTLQIGEADRKRKIAQATEFLEKGEQVQIQIQLRGRQKAHPERAVQYLENIIEELSPVSKAASIPTNTRLTVSLNPKKR